MDFAPILLTLRDISLEGVQQTQRSVKLQVEPTDE